ncbi:MAG: DinB family protein [Rhizobacter sp.]|nr:DinB family protein [Chlorobiales bacterium]
MTKPERLANIDLYGHAPELLSAAIASFPKEAWRFKPAPNRWSIHEILVHIADSEANSFVRCRRAIAEPAKSVMAYDQDAWAMNLNYLLQPAEDAVELFKVLRRNTYHLIKDLPDEIWANTISHPENGAMTLDDWLKVYAVHVPDHITQMEHNFTLWQTSQSK